MRMLTFSTRTAKEILRDPLTLVFGLGFPVLLLLMLTAIQSNIPVSIFEIESLAPGMTIFGLSFFTLFSAMLISRDRESALLQRMYATPMTAADFILGYTLPLLPLALVQGGVCYLVGIFLGLPVTVDILMGLVFLLPAALFFIGLGLLCGSLLTSKQVGGICGALITNLTAFLSGIWFDLEMVGEGFAKVADCLPFVHAAESQRAAYLGQYAAAGEELLWVGGFAVGILMLAVLSFLHQMKKA